MSRTLYLLDGMALLYRAHFAFIARPVINSKGVNTSAVMGFANTLLDLLNNRQPTHLAVALDTAAPTERHALFPAYKAQREEMPEDLRVAVPKTIELLQAMNIPLLMLDGYEADDLIGTLARRAADDGFQTYMVTSDKDFGQLVDASTFIYQPAKGGAEAQILGVGEVCARWGITRPGQVIDTLALMGDSADNIPGVPGIGPKTAQRLIAEYDTLENLLANTSNLKGKPKDLLAQYADQARLCKKLATINCAAPLTVTPADLARREKNATALARLLDELEFNALGKRLLGEQFKVRRRAGSADADLFTLTAEPANKQAAVVEIIAPPPERPRYQTAGETPHHYESVVSADRRAHWRRQLAAGGAFAFDTETSSLDPRAAVLLGLSFCGAAGEACFIHLPADRDEAKGILAEFAPLFADDKIEKIGHNLKFDLGMLCAHGLTVSGPFFDTMIAHALIEPEQRHNLNLLAEIYLHYSPIAIETLIGERGGAQQSMLTVNKDALAEYAAEDADLAWQLRAKFAPLLAAHNQERVFYDIEMPLLVPLTAMEAAGVYVDILALENFSGQLTAEIDRTTREIHRLAGHEFNLNSPRQLGVVLFDELKIADQPKKTKTGQYTTNEQVLQALAGAHPIVGQLLDYRAAAKLKSTYVDALPALIAKQTGRVHTTYHQVTTTTGRLASVNPNLQNIPVRTALGREIRKAFTADPRLADTLILSADYSQIELRIIAALSQDPAMLAAFADGEDVHTATAARVFGVTVSAVTPEMRRRAKMVNFGIAYGISAFGLAQRLGIPRGEAADIIAQYNKQFGGIQAYMERTLTACRASGYVETVTGRRRYIRDINSANATVRAAAERNAINMPIQGSAADMIKIAMTGIHRALTARGWRTRLLLQVHDELVFELYRPEEAAARALIAEQMKTAIPLPVPIEVEIGVGPNWLAAH
ncbi:MAG: DNA polymerase I [Verrucomicrobiales bacterium]|jgi:DNA polymerase-1|nr:DNA polymerase I [Verrucomicrobiales bacterium]